MNKRQRPSTIAFLESFGGQALLLFAVFGVTVVNSVLRIPETDLMKQAFAAIIGFLTARALPSSNNTPKNKG